MNPQNHHYRAAARRLYEREGAIEIETYAEVHDADHAPGVWIEALVYVSDAEALAEVEPRREEAPASDYRGGRHGHVDPDLHDRARRRPRPGRSARPGLPPNAQAHTARDAYCRRQRPEAGAHGARVCRPQGTEAAVMSTKTLAYTETADQLAAVAFKAAYHDGPSAIANILRQVATGRIVIADARPGPETKSLRGLLESGLPDSLLNRRGVAISQAYAVVLWLGGPEGQALAREAAPDNDSSNDAGAAMMNGTPAQQKEN